MLKSSHEIRDPIHVFIRLDSDERRVLDSRPFQRLRHIHQLALSYLVYPSATHKRFEHSLGVMELASRIFDRVTQPEFIQDSLRDLIPVNELSYWRRVLRMAALCHDMGHLPFSHAAEDELLPEGWDHERLTRAIIQSPEMAAIWDKMAVPLKIDDIVRLALGPRRAGDLGFNMWQAILSEIIVGDAFGADRIDYLLRDSYHTGVAYGRFDHHRLIDTLRILPPAVDPAPSSGPESKGEPTLGVERGGLQSAEALLLARYFMFSQVYFHRVRRIYDLHLKDFLRDHLENGSFPTEVATHLSWTDNEVTAAIFSASRDPAARGHSAAKAIAHREHFKVLWEWNPVDAENPYRGRELFAEAELRFGSGNVRHDKLERGASIANFPVLLRDGKVLSSTLLSTVLTALPTASIEYLFIHPDLRKDGIEWLAANKDRVFHQERGDNR